MTTTLERGTKPLGGKAYGSIPHLPESRMGPGDHHCHPGQARICTERVRDQHDRVIVTEKLDGSCTAVALLGGQVLALGRAGHLAQSSPYRQHQLFAAWVRQHEHRFRDVLNEGERVVGEWLAQAHGTRYALAHEPWVCFDLFTADGKRATWVEQVQRAMRGEFVVPFVVSVDEPLPVAEALDVLQRRSRHGALDPIEGAVWRVERRGAFDFLAKYVRPEKVDGLYLPERTGADPIWHWQPEQMK